MVMVQVDSLITKVPTEDENMTLVFQPYWLLFLFWSMVFNEMHIYKSFFYFLQVFREHCIDGSGLVVLSESHMTRILGMKLGPVIRLKAAIARLLRRSTSPSSSLASA